jgi:hypothetical protein
MLVNRQFARLFECNSNGDSQSLVSIPPILAPNANGFSVATDSSFNGFPVTGAEYDVELSALGGPTVLGRIEVGAHCKF